MAEKNTSFLCGGVMFFLMLQALLPNGSAKDHREGIKDEHSQGVLMNDAVVMFTDSDCYPVSTKDASNYLNCQSEGSVNLPFNEIAPVTVFDVLVHENYPEALNRMKQFLKAHFNPKMKKWYVMALLDILENDVSIAEDEKFSILADGQTVTKAEIRKKTDFELESFVLGVFDYVLVNRRGKNQQGIDTLNSFTEKKEKKPRYYSGYVGKNIKRDITVTLWNPASEGAEHNNEFSDDINSSRQNKTASEADAVDTEVIDEEESSSDKEKRTYIQHQTNVVQNGDHNISVTNNGVINFSFSGDDE